MIPIVFGYQTKTKRMAFDKPVFMATDIGSQVLIQLKIPWNFLFSYLGFPKGKNTIGFKLPRN